MKKIALFLLIVMVLSVALVTVSCDKREGTLSAINLAADKQYALVGETIHFNLTTFDANPKYGLNGSEIKSQIFFWVAKDGVIYRDTVKTSWDYFRTDGSFTPTSEGLYEFCIIYVEYLYGDSQYNNYKKFGPDTKFQSASIKSNIVKIKVGTTANEEYGDNINVTIVNGETQSKYLLMCGEVPEIDPYVKKGYYLKGFYDQEVGGIKYFEPSGRGTAVWQKDFPTTFYAQWGSLTNLSYTSDLIYPEPKSFDGHGAYRNSLTFELPETFKNAIKGNLDATFKVKVSMYAKGKPARNRFIMSLYDTTKNSQQRLARVDIENSPLTDSNYNKVEIEVEISADMITEGVIVLYFGWGWEGTNNSYYAKNFMLEMSYVEKL